ncbi:MAG TPA: 30S ribosomal protein S14 [Arenicellales bacterium]|jgi:small subunit ribosomal protein S14|uniref:30S ribosomal protein S14 n=1 Tax=marine metagenome TaxID=408172 RepID=A0A382NCF7_9ZZZZ|nr:30S ribosomal protein S14 [Acidiferrobacteraceae bacterium]MDP6137506.1 30S ribosomal protein S14 [Arenicellales bacterium]MDP7221323.1 30S ribosomal protein S14 [Arenicellales bacterium]HCF73863.1 30S ribosomal protein S14 [Gammaproteobacteria bacterium]HJP08788.1 30S ribosomal protein S14 [Arenicellales bacterium]|tara:strand:- start:1788 stop:2093 length:306 start_codon:yes stop_codon:yes gene_type:complete
MAKKSMVAREVKRRRLVEQFKEQREQLKRQLLDPNLSYDERWQTMLDLQKLPRDSSRSRQRNRCALTGRPRGYFRRFGLARNALREVVMRGEAPGVVKSSW